MLVGLGASGRLGQAIAGFGYSKILIVSDSIISKLGLLKSPDRRIDRRRSVCGV
ncbi:MAG: hypothetical protein IPH54_20700 [Rhodoferax sp.]|nr:hypothetical protein [Rhodoferax sp.]